MTAQRNLAAFLLFLADNDHTGYLAYFGIAYFLSDFFTSGVKFASDSCRMEGLVYSFCIVMNIFGNRQDNSLKRCKP